MRFLEPVRMADDSGGPVWTRAKRHKGGGVPVVGLIVGALALLGAATAGLAIKERSFAGAGATLDGALAAVIDFGRGLVGQAGEEASAAADETAAAATAAAEKAASAAEAGAEAARDELTTTP
jgi:hypothetical protein